MKYMKISGSSLDTFQSCARKLEYEKVNERTPYDKALPLEKGTLLHLLMENFYRLVMIKVPRKEACEASINASRVKVIDLALSVQEGEEVIKQFGEYVKFYENETWVPVEVEVPFTKTLHVRPDTDSKEGLTVLYEGKKDLIVSTQQIPRIIVDHKSASRNSTPSRLQNQFMGYAWADGASNVMLNRVGFQKTLPPKERFKRYTMSYSRAMIEGWVRDTIYWCEWINLCFETNYFPPNYTSCDKFGGCIFREVCSGDPDDRMRKLQMMFTKRGAHDLYEEKSNDE